MNCQIDDLAYVRSTHPLKRLHGVTLTVKAFFPELDGEVNVWRFTFSGPPQKDDTGGMVRWGFIQDRYLVPISGAPLADETPIEANVPEALKLALGIEARSWA